MRAQLLMLTLASGCATTGVIRTDPLSTQGGDLSPYWNNIDADLVASAMIEDCAKKGWAASFQETHAGKKPIVKLMGVIKRTDDRNVNEQYFGKRLERELLNTGVRVVAAAGQEGINVDEKKRQSEHASDDTVKSQGNEVAADFTLQTIVNSQNESDGSGKTVRAYLVNMELVDVETNEKVWIGEKQIRKVAVQASAGW